MTMKQKFFTLYIIEVLSVSGILIFSEGFPIPQILSLYTFTKQGQWVTSISLAQWILNVKRILEIN